MGVEQKRPLTITDFRRMSGSGLPRNLDGNELIREAISPNGSAALDEKEIARLTSRISAEIEKGKKAVAIVLPDEQIIIMPTKSHNYRYLRLLIKAFPTGEFVPIQNFAELYEDPPAKKKLKHPIYSLRVTLKYHKGDKGHYKWGIEENPEGGAFRLAQLKPEKYPGKEKPKRTRPISVREIPDKVVLDSLGSGSDWPSRRLIETEQGEKARLSREKRALEEARETIRIKSSIVVITNMAHASDLLDKNIAELLKNLNPNKQLALDEIVGGSSPETLQKFFIEGFIETLLRWWNTKDINSIPAKEQSAAEICRDLKLKGDNTERIISWVAQHYSIHL